MKRILLVSLDNLGDLVFASALTPLLHQHFPAAQIDVWCKDYTADAAPLIPFVTDVIAADPFFARNPSGEKGGVASFIRSVHDVRNRQYDVAVLAGAPWRTAAAVAAAGIPMRIGHARHRNGPFLTHQIAPTDPRLPVVQELSRLLAPLGIADQARHYELDATKLQRDVRRLGASLPPLFVALHPFAADRARCLPLAEWMEVSAELRAAGMPTLWLGTATELTELRRANRAPDDMYSDHIARGSFATAIAALSRAAVFAGHDSGPLHVAGALALPVVGVFAPGEPARTFPQGAGASRMLAVARPDLLQADAILREVNDLLAATPFVELAASA